MMSERDKAELREWAHFILKIANKAAKEAIEENRALGLPEVFMRNGVLYIEKDGKIERLEKSSS